MPLIVYKERPRKYGFWSFVGDIIMTLITGGLWLIFIFVRESRNKG